MYYYKINFVFIAGSLNIGAATVSFEPIFKSGYLIAIFLDPCFIGITISGSGMGSGSGSGSSH